MKQSLKFSLPELSPIVSIKTFLQERKASNQFIAYVDEQIADHLKDISPKSSDYVVLIGPEGDFSSFEIDLALKNSYKPVSLGKSRLRTETAALVACHILNLVND